MKTLKTNDGQFIMTVYKFDDLQGNTRQKALDEHYDFLNSTNEVENEQGEMV